MIATFYQISLGEKYDSYSRQRFKKDYMNIKKLLRSEMVPDTLS